MVGGHQTSMRRKLAAPCYNQHRVRISTYHLGETAGRQQYPSRTSWRLTLQSPLQLPCTFPFELSLSARTRGEANQGLLDRAESGTQGWASMNRLFAVCGMRGVP